MRVQLRPRRLLVWVNENLHVGVETWSVDDAVLEVAAFVAELAERSAIVPDPRRDRNVQPAQTRAIESSAFRSVRRATRRVPE